MAHDMNEGVTTMTQDMNVRPLTDEETAQASGGGLFRGLKGDTALKRILSLLTAGALLLGLIACNTATQSAPNPSLASPAAASIAPQETAQPASPESTATPELTAEQKGASEYTSKINEEIYALLDFSDEQEFEFATRGLIAAPDALEIKDERGKVVWSQQAYGFVEGAKAPDTANPSLWRDTQLNHIYGLFEVMDGIYQVRGYDMSNLTVIAGETGWIVFDPLISVECAEAAMQLVYDNLGKRPISAVIYSHPHIDHFGGVKALVSDEDVANGVPIIAPEGFHENAVSENLYAGTAMGRRAGYQYGTMLEPGEAGGLAMGIGMGQSKGTTSYIPPNDIIAKTGETRVIDGVKMEFQMTPGTEAPAEMNTWFPDKNALWMAENCTGTLHNLYTLRGAQVRDGNAWAKYLMEAVTLYGYDAQVVFQAHNWPHWGNEELNEYIKNTAAMYKFINDQTLMFINQGYTEDEIAHMIALPDALEKTWYTRQYYGTVAHNAKAVYQRYMGWYDANPVSLNLLPLSESAQKMVEYLGDAELILEKARADFDKGEYQWVAEITRILVYANPSNTQARYLCADALEQLAYQSESGTWRNAYLSGAKELRSGMARTSENSSTSNGDLRRNLEPYMIFDFIGIRIDSNASQDLNMKINFDIVGDSKYLVTLKSGVLLWQKNAVSDDADATVTVPKAASALMLAPDSDENGLIQIEGDANILDKLLEQMVDFDPGFNIIEP